MAFVRADRVPARDSPDYFTAWPPAPDLAVEVASQHQLAPSMEARARFDLAFGSRLVWVIWPRYKHVEVWHPGEETATVLQAGEQLSGEDVVPGFTFPFARLFR